MTRLFLDLAYLLVAVVSLPWVLRKKRSGWGERFGNVEPLPPKKAGKPRVMIHAVSVGETNLVRALVSRLAEEAEVVVTVTTDTGMARATELYAGVAHVRRYPLDVSFSVTRFLRTVEPDAVALVELELWPNFVSLCARRGIPVCVINGRLSTRSFKGYRRFRFAVGRYFRRLAWAGAQDDAYAERFRAMGVPSVDVVGTMKWDAAPTETPTAQAGALAEAMGIDRTKPLVVAGSTAPGEHELLRDAMPAGVQLLCAPRRPEWWDEAAAVFPGCVRRSKPGEGDAASGRFILDTIGELRAAYAMADLALVGRSFVDLFGSDPMEPAALGKAVLIGPNVEDFRWVVEAMERDGAIVRTDRDRLAREIERLLNDDAARAELADRARACVERHRGATEAYAGKILAMLKG
ncbi:MAG: glycosyltransferase N-terminal domain-containing protein [Phycisphaerales bacterium]